MLALEHLAGMMGFAAVRCVLLLGESFQGVRQNWTMGVIAISMQIALVVTVAYTMDVSPVTGTCKLLLPKNGGRPILC